MVRPLRIQYPGAVYHVITRGNDKRDLFRTDEDRIDFLSNLGDCLALHNVACHAYCLMGHHHHLMIETPDGNLSQFMHDLNGNYAMGFHTRHGTSGHLYEGRFKSFVIEKEPYGLAVIAYIVNNPVKDGFVDHPQGWPWSSYGATAGIVRAPDWLETEFTLGLFGKKRSEAQRKYREFVKRRLIAESPYEGLKGNILGSPQFVHAIWDEVDGNEDVKEYSRDERIIGRPSLDELFETAITKRQRDDAIRFARFRCGYLNTEIARHLNMHDSTVSKIVRSKSKFKIQDLTPNV